MTKKNETRVIKRKKKEEPMTLLKAIEHVVEVSRESQLSADAQKKMADEVKFLAERYGITERQAILFAICMEKGPRRVDFYDLSRHLEVSKIRVLNYASDIDALVRRRLLRYHDVKEEDEFDIPAPVIKALKHNEVYQLPQRIGLDCAGLFELLGMWFNDLNNDAITPQELMGEIEDLFKENPQCGFVQKINELPLMCDDKLLLILFCHLCVNNNDNNISFCDIEDVFPCKSDFIRAKADLRSGEHVLMDLKLVEHRCEDGIADTSRFQLTAEAKRKLLSEMKIRGTEENIADVLKPEKLAEKKMFYTHANQQQVDDLHEYLRPEEFQKIRERMQQRGFHQGFTCLFYGGPGTGKTETVYQLARQTGRSIMVVDVPQIKSKWVGDSEKNIKALFDRYRELVKRSQLAPILLFNEADAIIGIRMQGASSAVDKMENSIQNIILQEMEALDGIMIATTNLTENLDTAFERRFLYKINFEKPDAQVRQHIWQQMMPELSDEEAQTLASGYDFSGGQIENIARKASINAILHGDKSNTLSQLTQYCQQERLGSKVEKRIGFC